MPKETQASPSNPGMQYQKIALKDLSLGIDQRSAETALQPGYAQMLLNCETNSQGYLAKRKGYQGVYGYVPLRVMEVQQNGNFIMLCFDTSINLLKSTPAPLVVYGKLGKPSSAPGITDWSATADRAHYYPNFTINARKAYPASATTTDTLTHTEGTPFLLTGIAASASSTTLDSSVVLTNGTSISKTTPYPVNFTLINGTTADISAFIYAQAATTVVGSRYAATFAAGDFVANVLTILVGTHNLNNLNTIIQVYRDTGSTYDLVEPDRITIKANGNIEIAVSATFNGMVVMQDVDPVQTAEMGVTASSPISKALTPVSGSSFYTMAYVRDPITGDRSQVIPDAVTYVESSNLLTFAVQPPVTGVLQVIYQPASIISNCVIVTDTQGHSATYTDLVPQMTVWGISQVGTYLPTSPFGGHVSHIDSYRRALEQRLVVGLGGTFYAGRTAAEVGATYLMPSTYIKLQDRVASTKIVGPVFVNTLEVTQLSRAVKATSIDGNFAVVTAANFTGTPGQVAIQLDLPGKSGTLAGITTADQLTVKGMAFSRLNNTFPIVSVNNSTNTIVVSIPSIISTDWNELGANGRAGVFTDNVTLVSTSPFISGDVLRSDIFTGTAVPTVISVAGPVIQLSGISTEFTVQGGLLLRGKRISTTIPVNSVLDFVLGDMCTFAGLKREVRVVGINTSLNTLTLDEVLTSEDLEGNIATIAVTGRWIPIEAPISIDDLPQTTYPQLLTNQSFDDQAIVRSAAIQDTLYFTNGADEVFKFDGSDIYRAGLQRWQPQLFMSLDTSAGGIIAGPLLTTVSAVSGAFFTVGSSAALTVGQKIIHTEDNAVYIITTIPSSTSILVDRNITGVGGGNIIQSRQLQYYFRLNMIDKNNNLIGSAITGADDNIITLTGSGAVNLKLIGMPVWDAYDYDRITLQIYRTNTDVIDFVLVADIDVTFNQHDGYLLYSDRADGDGVTKNPNGFDKINNSVSLTTAGVQELGTRWEQPLRAKYITTANNALILANITDYGEIDLVLQKTTGDDITIADLDQKTFLLKKSSTDPGSSSDMVNRAAYQLIDPSLQPGLTRTVTSTTWSANVLTINLSAPVTLPAGAWIYLYHGNLGGNSLRGAGWYQINAVASSVSILHVNLASYPALGSLVDVDIVAFASNPTYVPVILGQDGNYNQTTSNTLLSYEVLAIQRLANAINASMRVTDTALTGQALFTPWIVAAAGSEFGLGHMTLRCPKADLSPSLTLPGAVPGGAWASKGIVQNDTGLLIATERIFGSRVLFSYPNFSEIFNGPFGLDQDSATVFDIDPSDGQHITAIIPFFGDSAFGASLAEEMLVIFKENSIHLLKIATGERRKLETQGLGCTVPFSVAYTHQGINFANTSGIYRLNRDLTLSYVGIFVERLWQDNIVPLDLSRATATQFAVGRQYKLSVPYAGNTYNSHVLVYDHTRELAATLAAAYRYGAWDLDDNYPATGWANLGDDSFFGSTLGQVFRRRNEGEAADYRDDASPINQQIIMAANDFGIPGAVKIVRNLLVQYRLRYTDLTHAIPTLSVDLDNVFRPLDAFQIVKPVNQGGLDQQEVPLVKTISYKAPHVRGEYFQLQLIDAAIDEDMQVIGLIFLVAATEAQTITQAATTKP